MRDSLRMTYRVPAAAEKFSWRRHVLAPVPLAAVLLVAALSVLLAGGYPQGSVGLFFLVCGIVMIVIKPRSSVSPALWILAALLIFLAFSSFFPQGENAPPWKIALGTNPTVHLAPTLTISPAETVFWATIFALSVGIALFILSIPVTGFTLCLLGALASVLVAIYAGLAVYAHLSDWKAPFDGAYTFGFLPNRNHTATFLCTGFVLGLGSIIWAIRERQIILAVLAGSGSLTSALALGIFSNSRAGIFLLILGAVVWLVGLGKSRVTRPLIISTATLFLAGLILILTSSAARERLTAFFQRLSGMQNASATHLSDGDVTMDFRILIYRDSLSLVGDYPFTGSGMGTYSILYPLYAEASLRKARALHPESDWLMLAAECGIPMVLATMIALGYLLYHSRSGFDNEDWPIRWAFITAFLTACLHGVVDVPLHRVQLGFWIMLLGGIGFASSREFGSTRVFRVTARLCFILTGLASLWIGVLLMAAQWKDARPLPPFAPRELQANIRALQQSGRNNQAISIVRTALSVFPANKDFYFQAGLSALAFESTDKLVDNLFAAERALDPHSSKIPFLQGQAWLGRDPQRTAQLWIIALENQRLLDSKEQNSSPFGTQVILDSLRIGAKTPVVLDAMEPLLPHDPKLQMLWLSERRKANNFEEKATSGFLDHLSPQDQKEFFRLCYLRGGDTTALAKFISTRPDLDTVTWPVQSRLLAKQNQFQDAVLSVSKNAGLSIELSEGQNLESTSSDAKAFYEYWNAKNTVAAQRVLKSAADSPDILQIRIAIAAANKNWREAWRQTDQWLKKNGL